jgi:hypothetical protein
MTLIAPTLEAFLSELPDYVDLAARGSGMWRETGMWSA